MPLTEWALWLLWFLMFLSWCELWTAPLYCVPDMVAMISCWFYALTCIGINVSNLTYNSTTEFQEKDNFSVAKNRRLKLCKLTLHCFIHRINIKAGQQKLRFVFIFCISPPLASPYMQICNIMTYFLSDLFCLLSFNNLGICVCVIVCVHACM